MNTSSERPVVSSVSFTLRLRFTASAFLTDGMVDAKVNVQESYAHVNSSVVRHQQYGMKRRFSC